MTEQLTLQFEFKANQTFNNYHAGGNEETISHLLAFPSSPEQQIYLWGQRGSGRTHLLNALCHQAHQQNHSTFYLCLHKDRRPPLDILEGLEEINIVCLDNIDHVCRLPDWERALFNFYNRHRTQDGKLILTAECPPNLLTSSLPDLKTRMNWGLTLQIKPLNDTDQIQALICKAHQMGLEISEPIGRFLIQHYARDLSSIWSLLDEIDQATLSAKRKLTLPFLKRIMNPTTNSK